MIPVLLPRQRGIMDRFAECLADRGIQSPRGTTHARDHPRGQSSPGLSYICRAILEEDFQQVRRLANVLACLLLLGHIPLFHDPQFVKCERSR